MITTVIGATVMAGLFIGNIVNAMFIDKLINRVRDLESRTHFH